MAAIRNIHDLEVFERVVSTGSFTKAARALGMSQPAVSMAVKRLERQLGTELFLRQQFDSSDVSLTDAGKILVAHAGAALCEIDAAARKIESLERRRAIRLSLPPIILDRYFKDNMGALATAFQGHRVVVSSWGSQRTLEEIRHHNLDVGVVASAADELDIPHVRSRRVGTFPFCLALPAGQAAPCSGTSISFEEFCALPSLPFVSFTSDYMQRDILQGLSERCGRSIQIAAETDQISELKGLIETGVGVGFVTSLVMDGDALTLVPLTGPGAPTFNIFVFEDLSRPFHADDSCIQDILRVLRETIATPHPADPA